MNIVHTQNYAKDLIMEYHEHLMYEIDVNVFK